MDISARVVNRTINCQYGCVAGACRRFTPTCIDTDGFNTSRYGVVTARNSTGTFTMRDSCSGSSSQYLTEFICNSTLTDAATRYGIREAPYGWANYRFCVYGCSNGRCNP